MTSVVTTATGGQNFTKMFIGWKMLSNSCVSFEMCIKRYLAVHVLGAKNTTFRIFARAFSKKNNKYQITKKKK